jgi:DNA-binding LacI/PurR family transcriptional regulator
MGEEAANLLFHSLDARNVHNTGPRKLVLEPELIWRQSTMKHFSGDGQALKI